MSSRLFCFLKGENMNFNIGDRIGRNRYGFTDWSTTKDMQAFYRELIGDYITYSAARVPLFDEKISVPEPERILFSGGKTIVLWEDCPAKTIVSCGEKDEYDEYIGFASALAKKIFCTNSQIKKKIADWAKEGLYISYTDFVRLIARRCYGSDENVKKLIEAKTAYRTGADRLANPERRRLCLKNTTSI